MFEKPLGAYFSPNSTVFSVASENAMALDLCLFSQDEKNEHKIPMEKDGNIWKAEIKNIKPGQKYGYRAYGDYDPQNGLFFNPSKLAVDPYSFEISAPFTHWTSDSLNIENNLDSAPIMPKSVVINQNEIFDSSLICSRPNFPIGENIIYETHIKNFSFANPNINMEHRGRLSALSQDWTIDYLKKVGINTIELMPINPTCPGKQIPEKNGYFDNWGYNPYCYFAIDPRYGNLKDFTHVINSLHKNNIKVIVDAVFNHTGEHAARGYWNRALSFKLLDSPSYYRPDGNNKADYMNSTGCHNNFNLDSKLGQRMLHDYILFLHKLGVDGIRWDLAGDNALDNFGNFQDNGAFIQELKFASNKLNMEMYVEPWSALSGNFTGRFSLLVPNVKEWSDRRRYFVADFFNSRENTAAEFANQIAGSAIQSISLNESAMVGTAFTHDGFSLLGAFKYHKDTYPNGENGFDGSPDIYIKSSDETELFKRAASSAALNILSKGIPLLRNGDEQSFASPNNNPYCIDDKSVWLNWKNLNPNEKLLFKTICKIIALRKKHPIFHDLKLFTGEIIPQNNTKDITWLRPDGTERSCEDWNNPSLKTGAYMLNGAATSSRKEDDDFLILASGDNKNTITYTLPKPPSGGKWQLLIDTSERRESHQVVLLNPNDTYALKPFAFVILTKKKNIMKVKQKYLLNLIQKHKQRD